MKRRTNIACSDVEDTEAVVSTVSVRRDTCNKTVTRCIRHELVYDNQQRTSRAKDTIPKPNNKLSAEDTCYDNMPEHYYTEFTDDELAEHYGISRTKIVADRRKCGHYKVTPTDTHTKLTQAKADNIRELVNKGYTYTEAGNVYGVTKATVYKIIKNMRYV